MKILQRILKKPLSGTKVPKKREVYACGTGVYCGEMFVFMENAGGSYKFLSVPKMINREIPVDRWDWAAKAQIIEFAHELPSEVYGICRKQWEKNLIASEPIK